MTLNLYVWITTEYSRLNEYSLEYGIAIWSCLYFVIPFQLDNDF